MPSFEDIVWPLTSLDQLFSLLYISSKCNPNLEISFITKSFNDLYNSTFTECDIENVLNKTTNFNYKSFMKTIEKIDILISKKQILCAPIYRNCIDCKSELEFKKQSSCVVFCLNEIKKGLLISTACKDCDIIYYIDKYEKSNVFHSYKSMHFISTSSESIFEV